MSDKRTDKYVNIVTRAFTMSAANTLTFSELQLGFNLFDKIGLVVHRLEYEFSSIGQMTTTADSFQIALTTSDKIVGLGSDQIEVIDVGVLYRHDFGAAASGQMLFYPYVHDFSMLPGGGLLVPPKPLYVAMLTGGFATAATGVLRVYFTMQPLADTEYLELLETRRAF